jgi:hypothetical protein
VLFYFVFLALGITYHSDCRHSIPRLGSGVQPLNETTHIVARWICMYGLIDLGSDRPCYEEHISCNE